MTTVTGCSWFWVYCRETPAVLIKGGDPVGLVGNRVYSIVALGPTPGPTPLTTGSWRTVGGRVIKLVEGPPSDLETKLWGTRCPGVKVKSDRRIVEVTIPSPGHATPPRFAKSVRFPRPAFKPQEWFLRWSIRSCFFPEATIEGGHALPELAGLVVDNASFDFWVGASIKSVTPAFLGFLATSPPPDADVLSLAALVITAPGWTSFWRDDGDEEDGNGDTNGNVVGSLGYGDCEDSAAFVVAARAGLDAVVPSTPLGTRPPPQVPGPSRVLTEPPPPSPRYQTRPEFSPSPHLSPPRYLSPRRHPRPLSHQPHHRQRLHPPRHRKPRPRRAKGSSLGPRLGRHHRRRFDRHSRNYKPVPLVPIGRSRPVETTVSGAIAAPRRNHHPSPNQTGRLPLNRGRVHTRVPSQHHRRFSRQLRRRRGHHVATPVYPSHPNGRHPRSTLGLSRLASSRLEIAPRNGAERSTGGSTRSSVGDTRRDTHHTAQSRVELETRTTTTTTPMYWDLADFDRWCPIRSWYAAPTLEKSKQINFTPATTTPTAPTKETPPPPMTPPRETITPPPRG